MGAGPECDNNNSSCDKRNDRCYLCTSDYVANIDHSCKYRSICIAETVFNIHKSILNVKLTQERARGISSSKAEAMPVRMEEATRSVAR